MRIIKHSFLVLLSTIFKIHLIFVLKVIKTIVKNVFHINKKYYHNGLFL